jgi:hypothetical protein
MPDMRGDRTTPAGGRGAEPDRERQTVPWVESVSPSFRARFDAADAEDVSRALDTLERRRDALDRLLTRTPGDVEVVFHPSATGLDLARPLLPLTRRRDAPAARRYRAGTASRSRIDVLAPRVLAERASAVPGSRQMLEALPGALYARLALLRVNPALRGRIPFTTPAWHLEGAAAWLGGQSPHARPAVLRRLREGSEPAFPPRRADASLLGGTVFELLAREEGEAATLDLALSRPGAGALGEAFRGRSLAGTEAAWRASLTR